jgi:S-adenosylmethionine synthetase
MMNFVLASDSCLPGHPDKLCDRISDALVDGCLGQDRPQAVNAECAIASGVVFVALRHAGPLTIDAAAVARRVIAETGYDPEVFSAEDTTVLVDAVRDDVMPGPGGVKNGVPSGISTVFGYACKHTPEMLPATVSTAHLIARAVDEARAGDALNWLSPDGQIQIAAEFHQRRPTRLRGIVGQFGLRAGADHAATEALETIIRAALADTWPGIDDALPFSLVLVPSPRGPKAHAGLTGRKTADDCYGGFVRHGASALSGKDPSRVERSAAYAARHAALSVVAAELAEECEVQLCYGPDTDVPISVEIDCFGAATTNDREVSAAVQRGFDFRAAAIAERFRLWTLPSERGGRFYGDLAVYGQMGRVDLDAPWELPDTALAR